MQSEFVPFDGLFILVLMPKKDESFHRFPEKADWEFSGAPQITQISLPFVKFAYFYGSFKLP